MSLRTRIADPRANLRPARPSKLSRAAGVFSMATTLIYGPTLAPR